MPLDLSSAAGATPYGAAFNAAAGVLNSALQDTPTSVTSGAGSFQAGPFVVGSKQVGGKGNSAGATTASASQSPLQERAAGDAVANLNTNAKTYAIVGGIVAVVIAIAFIFSGGKRGKKR